jgi:hypothetical protein
LPRYGFGENLPIKETLGWKQGKPKIGEEVATIPFYSSKSRKYKA